jgi:ligand-binding sensor domain-containing protein
LPFALTVLCLSASLHFSDLTLFAQDQLLSVFYFQQVKGLTTGEIRSYVVRDPKGLVWVGTVNCLNRYDGYGVKEYWKNPSDLHAISSSTVHCMYVDRKNRLWLGTHESGLSLYDPLRDRFVNFIPRPGDSSWYQSQFIATLLEDRSGNIWMTTSYGGVARVELPSGNIADSDSLFHKVHFTTYPLGTPRNIASSMLEREDGRILIASDGGMIVLDPRTSEMSRLHFSDPTGRRLDSLNILSLIQDSHGNLWVGTHDEGLYWLSQKSQRFPLYGLRDKDGSSPIFFTSVDRDKGGACWFMSSRGVLHQINIMTHKVVKRIDILHGQLLSYQLIPTFIDRRGIYWDGTWGLGLFWVDLKNGHIRNYSVCVERRTR